MKFSVCVVSLLLGFLNLYPCQKCKRDDILVYDCTNLSLSELPTEKLENAYKLDLSHNAIEILQNDSFLDRELVDVGILYMQNNKITTIEVNAFRGMVELDFLNLNNNNIAELPADIFKSNAKLRFLRFENNTHLQLPQVGFILPELNVLDLERCGLETIPTNFFAHMTDLEILYLRGNRLSYLDSELIKPLIELEFLDLRENLFTKLQQDILRMPLIFKISYVGNPLQCDCALLRAYSLYKKKAQYEDLSCKNDDDIIETDLSKLANQLDCNPSTSSLRPSDDSTVAIQDGSTPVQDSSESQDMNAEKSDYKIHKESENTASESWLKANKVWVIITSIIISVLLFISVIIIIKRKQVKMYLVNTNNRFTTLKNEQESRDNDSFDGIHTI